MNFQREAIYLKLGPLQPSDSAFNHFVITQKNKMHLFGTDNILPSENKEEPEHTNRAAK